jgi:hypothetical protein
MTDQDEAVEVRQIWSGLGLPGVIDVHTCTAIRGCG